MAAAPAGGGATAGARRAAARRAGGAGVPERGGAQTATGATGFGSIAAATEPPAGRSSRLA